MTRPTPPPPDAAPGDGIDPEARKIAAAMPRLRPEQLDEIAAIIGRARRNARREQQGGPPAPRRR